MAKPPAPASEEVEEEVKSPPPQSPPSDVGQGQPVAKKLPGMGGFKIPNLLEGLNKSKVSVKMNSAALLE